jgi:EpsD family peptidyl-prolyl cis-trans isomerase
MSVKKQQILISALLISTLLIGGCGKKETESSKKSNDQVVAKVNGEEITIHQVNFQLSRMGQMSQEQSKVASKQVLANLVTQELLKQKALDAKLDQDPMILQALALSKDQLLAQAYLQKTIEKAPKASTNEIDSFYKEHPELFENRRVFRLQELVVNINKDKFDETEATLNTIKDINQIATWLRDNNYPFTVNSNVKAAEELPMALLNKLQGLKDGEIMFVPNDKTFNILQITASQTQPISRSKATPIIEQYFFNQNKNNIAKKEMLALNEKANIEFVGAFSDMKKSDLLKSKDAIVEAAPKAETKPQPKSADDLKDKKSNVDVNPSSINKGLSGL